MRIDVHTHFIPPSIIDAARNGRCIDNVRIENRGSEEWVLHPQGYHYPLKEEFWNVGAKLRQMDELGLDASVLSISPTMFFYWAGEEAAASFCRVANEAVAEMAAKSEGRLFGMATVPLQNPTAAADELRHAVNRLHLKGVEIGTIAEDLSLDGPELEPFFSAAEELGVPVMLHPYYVGTKPQFTDFYMTNLIGNPLDTTVAAARLILSGFLDRHPRLTVLLVHAGGFLPYQIGRLDHGYQVREETSARIDRLPSSYLGRFVFDTITHAPVPLRFLVDLVGKSNVVIGTDIPFDMADMVFSERLSTAGLTADELSAVESDNAEEIFALK